jgi:hypothetical protein
MTNAFLTKKIIALHEQGYDQDFKFADDNLLLCVQTDKYYDMAGVTFRLEDQQYDYLSHSFKYLHTIETGSGEKGILLMDGILTLNKQKGNGYCPETSSRSPYAIVDLQLF